ncbi:OLC1v1005388C1 [Oldenlandia corymbosa var. corymbosa]|uniref:OLC1v1005388C1 n=1 Tax=Oldenlandia corymbosa var. corymbosa TaxID=529605 RepID=A0AAV1DEF8_OLDCO|nr:OLC1v1005388C1 [Oldenlandia corymbosa var. corymbosa]
MAVKIVGAACNGEIDACGGAWDCVGVGERTQQQWRSTQRHRTTSGDADHPISRSDATRRTSTWIYYRRVTLHWNNLSFSWLGGLPMHRLAGTPAIGWLSGYLIQIGLILNFATIHPSETTSESKICDIEGANHVDRVGVLISVWVTGIFVFDGDARKRPSSCGSRRRRKMSASLAAFERPRIGTSNTVFKSGPLFISSKGLGWKSWKKRWFILTRTSLVFFKNDPSALPQRGGEVNLTLGGIDLNNSGSVVVREDKKLLTVLFPDGRDGRAFTLKAESSEDLYEWKTALEQALAQAPSAALVMGHNGIFRNDNDSIDSSFHQWRDKRPVKSMVVGRPILLALEDIDGGPSFLEKALQFLEKYGTKVEGILRQSADVEEVDRRVQDYEQGRTEFEPDEDAHVIGDCVKHVLRELPSSPVPASCCTALLEAQKIDGKEARVNAMRSAILETFPEPNRRLLQRILKMMHTISTHVSENRMTPSAVAACMAPLLLRPLLAGECECEDDFDVDGDNSAQLLAAANAANNAQAIVTTLLEEYDNIFDDDNLQRCSISADSHIENSGSEESSDEETLNKKDNGYHDAENEVDLETDDDDDRVLSGKLSETSGSVASDLYDYKACGGDDSDFGSPRGNNSFGPKSNPSVDSQVHQDTSIPFNEQVNLKKNTKLNGRGSSSQLAGSEPQRSMGEILSSIDHGLHQSNSGPETSVDKSINRVATSNTNTKKSTFWGRNNGRKTPLAGSFDSSGEEELAIQRLEITKNDLRHRIAKEARGNAILQASLERRKQALHERRLALEQDVARLQEQLQAERDLRAALEVGLSMSSGQFSGSRGMDSKTRAELEEIALAEADVARLKQKVAELHQQLNQQRQHHYGSLSDTSDRYQHASNHISQQKYFQQDFDATLAFCNHERKQRTEELLGSDSRNVKGQLLASGSSSRQPTRKQFMDSPSLGDSKSTEASTSLSLEELGAVDSTSVPSSSRAEVIDYSRNPSTASSTLIELTTRLDFFKERRSQLMEQLHNLDLNYGTTAHDLMYKAASPRWN